jgi:hypothetical protein
LGCFAPKAGGGFAGFKLIRFGVPLNGRGCWACGTGWPLGWLGLGWDGCGDWADHGRNTPGYGWFSDFWEYKTLSRILLLSASLFPAKIGKIPYLSNTNLFKRYKTGN